MTDTDTDTVTVAQFTAALKEQSCPLVDRDARHNRRIGAMHLILGHDTLGHRAGRILDDLGLNTPGEVRAVNDMELLNVPTLGRDALVRIRIVTDPAYRQMTLAEAERKISASVDAHAAMRRFASRRTGRLDPEGIRAQLDKDLAHCLWRWADSDLRKHPMHFVVDHNDAGHAAFLSLVEAGVENYRTLLDLSVEQVRSLSGLSANETSRMLGLASVLT